MSGQLHYRRFLEMIRIGEWRRETPLRTTATDGTGSAHGPRGGRWIGLHSKKLKTVQFLWVNFSLTDSWLSCLNTQGTKTNVSHPFRVNSLFSYSAFSLSGGNKELDSPAWMVEKWKIFVTTSAWQSRNGSVWMPQVLKSLCLIYFWWFPFAHFMPSSISLWQSQQVRLGFGIRGFGKNY